MAGSEIPGAFLRTPLLKNITSSCFWQFQVSSLQLYSLKETPEKLFICEFCKNFKNIFSQSTSGWLHLWILSFSDHLFYRAPLGRNCLFHAQVAGFQPLDTAKKCLTSAFQAFYKRTRSSYSKAFIYLKSLKIICEEVKVACVVKIKLFFMDWFYYNLIILIK